MPADTTQRPPMPDTLAQCIEREREAERLTSVALQALGHQARTDAIAARDTARAATDEAVRRVEGRQELVRERARLLMRAVADYRGWGNGGATATTFAAVGAEAMTRLDGIAKLCDALWDTILAAAPAPIAQGDTTGGASDE